LTIEKKPYVRLEVRVDLDPKIHFSMQQNDVPVIKALEVENQTDESLRDLEVRISAEPAFAVAWSARVAGIEPGDVFHLETVDLELSPGFLAELTERLRGRLNVEIHREGNVLAQSSQSVELLARDEWAGLTSLPEILAAFVLPNHPAIEPVLRGAAELLETWTGDPSLGGYQARDPKRVYRMAAAVYGALQKLELTYVNPPASFEDEGQRVRLPDRILESRMATCLDMALLAAGCLEQAGLHPLLVVVRGHAFVGVWMDEECFAEPALDDGLRLRKYVELGEIGVFDPTGVTARPALDFERAVSEAKRQLAIDDAFLCAIDVRRARKGRIRPLPLQVARAAAEGQGDLAEGASSVAAAPDLSGLAWRPDGPLDAEPSAAESPKTRLDRWCMKLLDLSLRNRLLNFVDSKKTLPLLCPDLGALEDMLAEGAAFRVLPRPEDMGDRDPRDAAAHERRTGQEALQELLRDELDSKRLRAKVGDEELQRRMIEIYRAARLGLEEGGASALYLALGFLAWYESPKSEQRRLAPVLLVPLEVTRAAVREGFRLRLADDDPRINVTLLEMLSRDQGLVVEGLDPLPEDESGLDVQAILHTVRRAVRDIDRWEVIEEARIGLFSFTKFLMWRDLRERADELMQNAVVEHLVNRPQEPFDSGGAFPAADRLDEERPAVATFCPMPADSSQLAAVFAAAEGRSFVLEGPPGTGKSQTITNLIAHCLAEGKTVLFVSEKMAALNVVHRRLGSVGLGRFCLELHSNKAHKRQVIDQLDRALDRLAVKSEEDWAREAQRIEGLRAELNAYVHALHRPRSTGETAYQATSRLIGLRDIPRVDLRWPDPEALDRDALAALRERVEQLATVAAACGEVANHVWSGVGQAHWTPGWQEEAQRVIENLRAALEILGERAYAISKRLGLAESAWSSIELEVLQRVAGLLLASESPPTELVERSGWDEVAEQVEEWIAWGRERESLRAELFESYSESILELDLDALQAQIASAEASWWPMSWSRRRVVRRELRKVRRSGRAPRPEELSPALDLASRLRAACSKLESVAAEAQLLLGRYWKQGEADWERVAELRGWAGELRAQAARAAGEDLERTAELRQRWARLASEGRDLLRPEASLGRDLVAYGDAYEAFEQARQQVTELLQLDEDAMWGDDREPDLLGTLRARVTRWQSSSAQLREWCAWRSARQGALGAQLGPLITAYEAGEFRSDQLRAVFERSYTQWWQAALLDREPVLSGFFSPEHERKIEQFRDADQRYMELTRELLEARLAQGVPTSSGANLPGSELGILKREIGRKRGHMPVRKLVQKLPTLLPRLKPCLLMSPMSVAQYLDASHPPFDLVVFDEASQIPVWDAVGAIARGRQAVIVGDPKQLPPTSFFQRASGDDEDDPGDGRVQDLESILDDCIAAQIPHRGLDWHYRSRHESLITFSNYHYYGNRLLTFPSPVREGLGVAWRRVPEGVYDRGKTRTNRVEADALVAEILRRLRDPDLAQLSIGVVTFSQAQQTLIEDLLDQARNEDSSLDTFFAEGRDEPLFVKNLENVQGDEREVILFSICYGPDLHGRPSMNFGPMNREGGERRLNVAITRARSEVVVFSTLTADQIDLSRTQAVGVRDLKRFLEYAERGASALAEATLYSSGADVESPFEQAVLDALVGRGWEVHLQVGCARYRIDLAVVDPDAPGRYLLGVECDGANYHRAKTARDRDKLREGVLRGLGWELHRVWSTDWWTDPAKELVKIEEALQRARTLSTRPTSGRGPVHKPKDEPIEQSSPARIAAAPTSRDPGQMDVPTQTRTTSGGDTPSASEPFELYRACEVPAGKGGREGFYERRAERAIRDALVRVVEHEGPISLTLAARRVSSAWGLERVTTRVLERVRGLLPRDQVRVEAVGEPVFLWPKGLDPASYRRFRIPGADARDARTADDLPPQEIANAIVHLLAAHGSAPEQEIVRETARLLGFQRTGRRVVESIRTGLSVLRERHWVLESDGNLALTRNAPRELGGAV